MSADPALTPDQHRRFAQTVACRDTDVLPKVPNAGGLIERDDVRLQVMHNGLVVEEGCYYGPMMTAIITELRGHHEPQEEIVFDTMVRRLAEAPGIEPVIVEFGSFWAYYTMWFCQQLPNARGVCLEPDPAYLQVGRRNAELNGLAERISFLAGAVGDAPGAGVEFTAESTGETVTVPQFDLQSLCAECDVTRVALAMVDIQGFESVLLPRAAELLRSGFVRFLIVSTHHQLISGDFLTHQKARNLLVGLGAHVIAEHAIGESCSGDGLLAVSFDPVDADLHVDVSRVRSVDTIWGEPEYRLAELHGQVAERDAVIAHYQRHVDRVEAELAAAQAELAADRH